MSEQLQLYDLSTRIIACEHLLKLALWNTLRMMNDQDGGDNAALIREAKAFTSQASAECQSATFTDLDPAQSDHYSDLVRGHVLRVLHELVADMETKLGGH